MTAPELLALNLFAGPGGWCEGIRLAGYGGDMVGVEWDAAACATAIAAGHKRIKADVARLDPSAFAGIVDKLIGSPPCGPFSMAGLGAGRRVLEVLATAMTRMARGLHVLAATRRACTAVLREHAAVHPKMSRWPRARRSQWARDQAVTTVLVLQPLRYALALNPRMIALEQVTAVQPLWNHLASILRELGYRVWTGVLDAEEYGVAQTRDRSILMAHLDKPVFKPEPTHQRYRRDLAYDTADGLFGPALPPPVTMREALGWGLPHRPAWTVTSGGVATGGAEVFGNARNRALLRQYERQANGGTRTLDAPSLTVLASHDNGNLRWTDGEQSRPITPAEVGVLQSFRPDFPWQGSRSAQYQQTGNAVPVLLAAAVLRPLVSRVAAGVAA